MSANSQRAVFSQSIESFPVLTSNAQCDAGKPFSVRECTPVQSAMMPSGKLVWCLRSLACGFFVLFLSATAGAQFRASIQGTVKDTAGGIIPDATVTVTSTE